MSPASQGFISRNLQILQADNGLIEWKELVSSQGLAHISQLSDRYIKDPNMAVKVQQKVMATVLEVDVKRKRISLSLKKNPDRPKQDRSQPQPKQERQPEKPQPDINALQQAFRKNRT